MLNFKITNVVFLSMSIFLLIFTSCIDANKHDDEDASKAADSLKNRTIEFSNVTNNRQKPYLRNSKINYLATAKDKEFWEDAFSALSKDEYQQLLSNIAELNNPDSLVTFAATQNLINAKNEGIKMLIEQVNVCKSDESKVKYLTTLRQSIKIPLSSDERNKISRILQNFTKENFEEVKINALAIWAEIVTETEFASIVKYLDVQNSSIRSKIYQRLSKATELNIEVLENLIFHLNSENIEVRSYAVNLLRLLTGQYFEYKPIGEPIGRQLAICRWTSYTIKLANP